MHKMVDITTNNTNGDNNDSTRLAGVTTVLENDIICGRGGLALKHPGNISYRKIVGLNKELYATCLKTEKLRISKSIVAAIREINGRFLEREDGKVSQTLQDKDEHGNPVTWKDIGDKRAIEKTSQALREGQPKLLKKLALQQEQQNQNGVGYQVGGGNMMNGHLHAPQSQMMPQQFGQNNMQPMQQQQPGFQQQQGGVPMHFQQAFQQAQQRPSFTAHQRGSLTMASLVEGQTFSTFPRNSFVEGSLNNPDTTGGQPRHESWHDSWGSDNNPAPLPTQAGRAPFDRSDRSNSRDSWGEEDPMPLPYNQGGNNMNSAEQVFSTEDQNQLMNALGVEGGAKPDNKRPSVKFQLEPHQRPSTSAMSLASALSEVSIFSDALSLDSAMDAAQRQAEFDMLGEFETGSGGELMSIGTFEDLSSSEKTPPSARQPRRSILRKSNKWTTNYFPPAPLNNNVDPGLLFTSTLDATPGGVNSGTDVSGLVGERRKSVVAFEIDVNRRRSSRMSMCSALTDFSGMFKRDIGSVLSIQSADFRELMADIEDDSSIEDEKAS